MVTKGNVSLNFIDSLYGNLNTNTLFKVLF